jgi:pimeloyl-ACP methyl ester carboxylesterase
VDYQVAVSARKEFGMGSVRVVRSIAAGVLTLTSAWPCAIFAGDLEQSSRAEATKIVAEMRRIVTPEGIERLEKVHIGGIDQWISVRGLDRRNPILLYIHGGPGFPAMPTSWYYQRGWEEYFTVVQWDQRGAGKTYLANDPEVVGPTMTPERMIADAEEMIGWLRREFDKRKIFVLGHSWGSYLGLEIARRHPQWLHAYIGMGQITDSLESERRGWRFAMDHARRAHNEQAVRELQSIAPYAQGNRLLQWKDVELQRKWLGFYGGAVRGRTRFDHEIVGTALAPEYSDADVESIWVASDFSEERLLPTVLRTDFSSVTTLECPIILFSGRDDYNVSATTAAEWFERLHAPSKTLVWFERSAHEIVNEEPGKVLLSLVQYARPIAKRAGDISPP